VKTEPYMRIPFYVDAVRVTEENMAEVAEWAGGNVLQSNMRTKTEVEPYIQINVHTPMNERQKMAFVGDWVLKTGNGFKVYMNAGFKRMFQAVPKK
jgi:predicted LPLAT superfamily acyltransferase